MKAILAAAALVVAGAQADAAIYELKFTPERDLESLNGAYTFFLDIPSPGNLNITESSPEIVGVGRLGYFETELPLSVSYFSLITDPVGTLLNVRWAWGYGDSGANFWLTGYSWYSWPEFDGDPFIYEEASGSWALSISASENLAPVPLPASAALLLAALAGLAGYRRFKA